MKKKWLVRIALVVLVLFAVWETAGYYFVLADAKKVAADINAGKAVWSDYYKLDLSENLAEYLLEEENPGIVSKIMTDAKISIQVSPLILNSAKVTFIINTIDYVNFVKHCEGQGIVEHGQMLTEFENYKTQGKTMTYEIPVTWKWNITNCEKELQVVELADAATGGFVSYYRELMSAAEEDLEHLLGGEISETTDE